MIIKKDRKIASSIYIGLIMIIILFVAESEALTNYGIIVPFIKFKAIIPIALIQFVFLGIVFFKKNVKMKMDIIGILLLIAYFLNIIPFLYNDLSNYNLGNYLIAILPFLTYFIVTNLGINYKSISKILLVCSIVIIAQCFHAYLLVGQYYSQAFYKSYFVLPIGPTNYICCALLFLLIFNDYFLKRNWLKFLFYFLFGLAIFFTKSRTGIILFLGYFCVKTIMFFLKKNDWKKKIYLFFIGMFIFTVTIIYVLSNKDLLDKVISLFSGFLDSTDENIFDSLLSGRLELYGMLLDKIIESPFFGHGINYTPFEMRSHNFILAILYEIGIFGMIAYLFIAFYIGKNIGKIKNKKYKELCILLIAFVCVNALIEDSLFTLPMDFLFWTFIAMIKCNIFPKNNALNSTPQIKKEGIQNF